jgi:hypothetical protein
MSWAMGEGWLHVLVLVSIDPHAYNETIGIVIGKLRPHLEVRIIEPEDLEAKVALLHPEVVIGGLPETATAGAKFAWAEFSPYDEPAARIRVGTRRWELCDVSFDDLLSVVDEAERIARTGER